MSEIRSADVTIGFLLVVQPAFATSLLYHLSAIMMSHSFCDLVATPVVKVVRGKCSPPAYDCE